MQLLFKEKRSPFFSVKREMPIMFLVNCERTVLFSVKRDLDQPPPPPPPPFNALEKNYIVFQHFFQSKGNV